MNAHGDDDAEHARDINQRLQRYQKCQDDAAEEAAKRLSQTVINGIASVALTGKSTSTCLEHKMPVPIKNEAKVELNIDRVTTEIEDFFRDMTRNGADRGANHRTLHICERSNNCTCADPMGPCDCDGDADYRYFDVLSAKCDRGSNANLTIELHFAHEIHLSPSKNLRLFYFDSVNDTNRSRGYDVRADFESAENGEREVPVLDIVRTLQVPQTTKSGAPPLQTGNGLGLGFGLGKAKARNNAKSSKSSGPRVIDTHVHFHSVCSSTAAEAGGAAFPLPEGVNVRKQSIDFAFNYMMWL